MVIAWRNENVTAVVTSYSSEKGYGYATTAEGRELLITVTAIRASGFRRVDVGEALTLEVCHRLEFGDTFSDKRAVVRIQKLPRASQPR